MEIWKMRPDVEKYEWFTPMGSEGFERLKFDGSPRADTWTPFPVKKIEYKALGDHPNLASGVPVFSEKAVEVLRDLLGSAVEILPLSSRHGPYFAINVLEVLDCIDYDQSEFRRLKSSGRIAEFYKYVFRQDIVENKHIFKIVDERKTYVFVSDSFRERVLASDLEGFKFVLAWDSEKTD